MTSVINRLHTFKVDLRDGPTVAAQRLHNVLQHLGHIILVSIEKTINYYSDQRAYYKFSLLYRRAAGSVYHAKLFSHASVADAESAINMFLAATPNTRAFTVLDLTEHLEHRVDAAHLVLIYDMDAPWPSGLNFDNFPVIARAISYIPVGAYGHVTALSFNFVSSARYVFNQGPYAWLPGKDGIVYYNERYETLVGFPTGCNVYGP